MLLIYADNLTKENTPTIATLRQGGHMKTILVDDMVLDMQLLELMRGYAGD